MKEDIFDWANIIELEKVFRKKSLLIDDYDFFWEIFEYSKDKNWKESFSLPDGDSLRSNFQPIDKIRSEMDLEKKRNYDENQNKQPFDPTMYSGMPSNGIISKF